MGSLRKLQENWEGLAQADPLWAICTDPERRHHKWSEQQFFDTGRNEIARVLHYIASLGLPIDNTAIALDFGCGVGRLTRALAGHFHECWGVDISPTMIDMATDLHRDTSNCKFFLNEAADLHHFSDGFFGFIYTSIVLQHIEKRYAQAYLLELVRVLKSGGVFVFQVADRDNSGLIRRFRNVVGFRSKLERLLKRNKIQSRMEMHCIREREIRELLSKQDVRILDVKITNSTESSFGGDLRFLEQEPRRGYVSKQYCVVKMS
ncbi:MAG: Methyltransferase type 11 [Acidobacteriales bacterium]|nr:Methyltransferase type 11 [Terriglobales bacterium]